MTETADAVVVGAGAIGTAVALELCRLGYRTLSIDRLGAPGHGSTSDSASIVRTYSSTVEMAALAWEAVPTWTGWAEYLDCADEVGFAHYVRTGSLVIERPGDDVVDRLTGPLGELAVDHEVWDHGRMAEALPGFDLRSFWPPRAVDDDRFWDDPTDCLRRALFVPEGGYVVDASLVAHNLATATVAAGGRFRYRAEVVAVRQSGGAVAGVTLADGTRVDAPVVVNVAGPHSGAVNRLAGVEEGMAVRTRPLRHELHVVPIPAGHPYATGGPCVSDGDLGVNFRPEPGGHVLVGSEDPECDPVEWVDDADRFDRGATVDQWERQVLRLARRLPDLPVPGRPTGLAGLYDVADDWMPIYDRSDLDGFYIAVGSSGTQFKAAPVAGYLMSRLVDACESGLDPDAHPLCLPGPTRGTPIDLSVFSRRRQPRLEAGFI